MTILFLNSIGTGEVIFIMLVVLMLFGSKSIPSLAKNLGRGMREIKTATNEIKRDLQNSALEMRKDLDIENPLKEMKDMIEKPFNDQPKDFKKDNPETSLTPPTESTPRNSVNTAATEPVTAPKNENKA